MKIIIIVFIIIICNQIYSQDKNITLAILDFENNCIQDREKFDPLTSGIPSMLASKLTNITKLKFVERERLNDVLNELNLDQSTEIDPSTAQNLGKLLGARALILGGFMILDDKMRVDLRIVETETGLTIKAEEVTGDSDNLFDIISELSEKINDGLHIKLSDGN
jgi:TolB-like protein